MPPTSSSPPILAGRYQLVRLVGRGAMGEVWAAQDRRLARKVAVKLLAPAVAADPEARRRFEDEARAAAHLNHRHVVAVHDAGEDGDVPFLVMELLAGPTLADELADGPLEPERVRQLGIQIAEALAASHQAGILHRDIKPANVLLTDDGSAKVGDFGIAKSAEGHDLTATGLVIGSAAYLAPERLRGGAATERSDLYALGVVLYQALSGRKPFDADTPLGVLRAVEAQRPVPLAEVRPGLPPDLVATVERAMAADPADRFASASELADALRVPTAPTAEPDAGRTLTLAGVVAQRSDPTTLAAAPDAGTGTTKIASGPTEPLPAGAVGPPRRRRHLDLAIVATLAVVLLIGLVVALTQRSSSSGTDQPTTTAAGSPATLPAGLDEALDRLEEAVRP